MSYLEKFLGAMLGGAIGDAIGELAVVHSNEKSLNDWLGEGDTLRYTDDTATSIAMAEAIIEVHGVDQNALGKALQRNYVREPWRGYSSSTPTIFAKVKRHEIPFCDAAAQLYDGKGSLGNGAAMRIAPLGLLYRNSESLRELAESSARVTHTHAIGIDSACVIAWTLGRLTNLKPEEPFPLNSFCTGIIKFAKTKEIRSKITTAIQLLADNAEPTEAASELRLSQRADETIPFAIYCFLKYRKSFQKCLYSAILNGGDKDTLGSITGSMSGAYLGKKAISEEWLKRIENGEYLESLAKQLVRLDDSVG